MRVLWVINAPIPAAATAVGVAPSHFATWIQSSHEALALQPGLQLSVAFPSEGGLREGSSDGTNYYTFPPVHVGEEDNGTQAIETLIRRVRPNIVHIFGTEGGHALAVARVCAGRNVPFVVGLQGLSTTIAQHYTSGLDASVVHGATVRDVIKRDNLSRQARKYAVRGRAEAETLRLTRYVIGRTTWDRAVAQQINPEAAYFTVPETLRPAFYDSRWTLDACQRKSLFVSQGHYPIKGLHFVLQAMPLILERHPEAQLWVSGLPPRSPGFSGWLKQTRYATHLKDMVRAANLEEHVHYTGVLDEVAMRDQYLSSHVFLSASTVENESNSLSEAKLLGMPVIASYVGGVVDRVDHGRTGWFYQHDASYMLAYYVDQVLQDDQRARTMGEAARTDSLLLNDPGRNARLLCDVYAHILQNPAV